MQMEGGGGAAAAAAFAVAAAEAAKADATARAAANAAADAADDAVDVDEVWALYRRVFAPGPADGTVAGGGSGGGGGGGGGGGRDGLAAATLDASLSALAALGRSTATGALPADGWVWRATGLAALRSAAILGGRPVLWAPSAPDDGDASLAAGTPAGATYNVHTGIHAAEARRGAAALETLLCDAAAGSAAHLADSDGRYPVLDGVVAAAGRVLVGARVGVPLGTLVRGVELVLGKADEWHRHFAAPALRLDGAMRGLAAAAAAWRGVEFAS
ncbi:hypothetical protein MMPV_005600 [Pyropia vietnamensis]